MAYRNKEDQLAAQRRCYRNNSAAYIAKVSERKVLLRKKVADYKSKLKCSKCPENHPACLEFHHVNDDKDMDIGGAVTQGWSWARIENEIKKCIVLCSNCHRKLHYEEAKSKLGI